LFLILSEICGFMLRVLQCAGTLKSPLESRPVTADLTTAVIHYSYKFLINDVNSFNHSLPKVGLGYSRSTKVWSKYEQKNKNTTKHTYTHKWKWRA